MSTLSAPMGLVRPVAWDRSPAPPRALWVGLAVTLAFACAATGCPKGEESGFDTLPVVTTDNPEAEADLQAAREAAEQDRSEEARARYRDFLHDHPNDPLVPVAKLGLGKLLLAEGETDEAGALFEEVEQHDDEAVAERGRFYRGVALHLAGKHAESLKLLRPFVGRTVDPENTALLLRTIAASSLHLGDRIGAIEAFDKLARGSVPEDEREQARERIAEIVDRELTAAEAQELYDRLPHDGPAWPRVARRALDASFEAGDMQRVHAIVESMRREDLELDEDVQAMALRAERTGQAEPHTVGAILPLSGRGREVGQLALHGLMLAAGMPAEQPVAPDSPRVIFRDDEGDPDKAVEAVNDLVSLHRVIAIVGPIDGRAARRAAERAQELGVPLIALSPGDDVTDVGPMIFRQFFTPAHEVRELVAAARDRGARRFAILHPEDGYGRTMRKHFERQVAAQGGELVAEVAHPPDATSFGKAVEELRRSRFDALFVANPARRLALVAPALAAAGLWSRPADAETPEDGRAITLLAPSVGFSPSLVGEASRYLQGALFALPFHADAAGSAGQDFVQRYEDRFGNEPSYFSAYAYDAFRLVRRAVDGGASSREQLAERLAGMREVRTVGPSRGFTSDREPLRGPRVFQLRGDSLERVRIPAPGGAQVSSR